MKAGKRMRRPAVAAALALALAAPAMAGDPADYPDHVKDEIRAADLEREARLIKLQRELQTLRNSALDVQTQKFREVLALLQTDREIRDLLRDYPELYPLYQSVLGADAAPLPQTGPGPDVDFCQCLQHAEVHWLGQKEQLGEAVLSLGGVLHDMRVGGKLGGSLCVLRNADERYAHLECRDPVRNRMLKRRIAIKKFHWLKDRDRDRGSAP